MDGEGHKYGGWKLTKTYVIKFAILRVTTTHFIQLWRTTNSSMMVIKFAYVGEFISGHRQVGLG